MAFVNYRSITIDHTKCGISDANTPVLVSGTYSYLKTVGNGGKVQNANGYDIGFYADSALTTKLNWETERYVASTGEVIYWVELSVPIASATDTVFYIAYNDATITTDQSNPTTLWSDFGFTSVYHLQNGSTLSAADATGNGNTGSISSATAVTGLIDGAASFNSAAKIDIGNQNSQFPFIYSAWIYPTGSSGYRSFIGASFGGGNNIEIRVNDTTNTIYLLAAGAVGLYSSTAAVVPNQWNFVAVDVDTDGNMFMAINTAFETAVVTYTFSTAGSILIGANSNSENFIGYIDEVRISLQSADPDGSEFTVIYNNQLSPSTFYAIGPEQGGGGGSVNSNFLMFN